MSVQYCDGCGTMENVSLIEDGYWLCGNCEKESKKYNDDVSCTLFFKEDGINTSKGSKRKTNPEEKG